ncbi:MAG: NTP transferase domain-containing protein, partial [Gammaproteobacteria bacterium]|nr:NTP transferase domain-containing protein [Gammaproteobacteria bacterium]
PAAIERAGGEVVHFGMPVDPGNLLLLGRHADVPVLGLPGCARSPKYNGLDQVLERLAAGIEVEPRTITGLGVGGLLKETPDRPQSRLRARPQNSSDPADSADDRNEEDAAPGAVSAARVAAVVLAAGQSRRMGIRNKLLEPVDGKPMLLHVLDTLAASAVDEVVVVTGHEAERVTELLGDRKLRVVHNPAYAEGLSTSLCAGLASLSDDVDAALVVLGDMPRLGAGEVDKLIAAFDPDEGRRICVPTVDGKRGNPVLWGREFFAQILQVRGDTGARHLIGEHDEVVCEVEMSGVGTLLDVDTPEALSALRQA